VDRLLIASNTQPNFHCDGAGPLRSLILMTALVESNHEGHEVHEESRRIAGARMRSTRPPMAARVEARLAKNKPLMNEMRLVFR
jgi:hypothetical protein